MLFLTILITGFSSFALWVYIARIAHETFGIIKEIDPDKYKDVLGGKNTSWLERGTYVPADIGIQFRLYKSIYGSENSQLADIRNKFVFALRLLFLVLLVFLVSIVILFGITILGV